eukprot:gene507-503_t
MYCPGLKSWWRAACLIVALCLLQGSFPTHARATALELRDDLLSIEAWPAVTVLPDPSGTLLVNDVLAELARFQTPPGTSGTLGVRAEPVWVRIPVTVPVASNGLWVLDIDYPVLQRIEVYLAADGHVTQQATLGSLQPYTQRPLRSRTHALPLTMLPGHAYDLLLRVETRGAMVLPITLNKPTTWHSKALNEQMLQGILTGLALCLLIYSLAQWLNLRDILFIQYALLITGSLLFSLHLFGLGTQYLWRDMPWMELHAASLAALTATCGSFLFISQALAGDRPRSRLLRSMRGGAVLCVVLAALYALDLLSTRAVTGIVSILGLVPALMGIPGAVRRARLGDPVGSTLLLAWLVYFLATATVIGVIQGWVPVNFWTLHSFQFGATLDMLLFMRVLGLRTKALRLEALDLQSLQQAQELGHKLLDAFRSPFSLNNVQVEIGLTIGYAIAPHDSTDAIGLLKLADAAMYSGKQGGKFCLRRNTGDLALSARLAKDARVAHFLSLAAKQPALSAAQASAPVLTWGAVAALEARIVGRIVLPSSPDYNAARQESNPAFQSYPEIIVFCACENDVLDTAGYSVNSGMVVDLSDLQGVVLDPARERVHVLPGTDFDHFNGAMNHTGWHVPTGACGSVCVGGFVQGGGYGYTSRAFGIQSDLVDSFRVAQANGTIITASAQEHPDLYWALRGGTGGNFGVVLQVTYRMQRLDQVWAWAISWDAVHAAQVLTLMQAGYMKTGAPDALGYMMNLGFQNGVPVYMVQGMFCGSREEGLAAIAPLMAIPSAQLLVDKTGTYPDMNVWLEDHPYTLPDNLPDGIAETKASGYINTRLSPADWQRIIDYFKTSPNPWSLAYLEPYGGAINRYPLADSAFVHRNVDADLVVDVFWRNPAERTQMEAWLDGFMQLVRPFLNGHVYQNYPDARLADFASAYWGPAYPQLQRIKAAYDPGNFFHFQQSIRLP